MIHERTFDFDTGEVRDMYTDDSGTKLELSEYDAKLARQATAYICPECGSPTFGKFEPFTQRGILSWCSNCGYQVVDKESYKAWLRTHPETYEGSNAQNG